MLLLPKPTETEMPRQINASVLPPPISPLRMQREASVFLFGGDSRTQNPVLRRLPFLALNLYCAKHSNASVLLTQAFFQRKRWRDSSFPLIHQKEKQRHKPLFFFLVETAELESATPCMSSKYSNQLSYASVWCYYTTKAFRMQYPKRKFTIFS